MRIFRTLVVAGCLVLSCNASHAFADTGGTVHIFVADFRIFVADSGDGATAKVTLDSRTYRVPISFEVGLNWKDVRDAYSIPAAFGELLKQGRIRIYITCSGAEFHVTRR